ncbi:MAG: hypothetical protein BWK79_17725 [Beggiatoa sp. IS2]|nr:MAG: hypothetical protein BWK79_17725 [Beggiatoa sp. IS2]
MEEFVNFDELSQEQKIMVVMRKVLTTIVRETAPHPGHSSPFSEQTIEDIRLCLSLISARERELAEAQGIINHARPHYTDEIPTSQVVSWHDLKKNNE